MERGVHEDDRTAYHEDHADINWADRNSRPDILFQVGDSWLATICYWVFVLSWDMANADQPR